MFPEFIDRLPVRRNIGNAFMPKTAGVSCLIALAATCSPILAKTALAQDFTGAVYAATNA
jgi:hypothetical protein